MRTAWLALTAAALLLAGCSGGQTEPDGFPAPYPSAAAGDRVDPEAKVTVDVIAPASLDVDVPFNAVIRITSTRATAVVPRLLLAEATSLSSDSPTEAWFTVATEGQPDIPGRQVGPDPGIGRSWSWIGYGMEYTLGSVAVDGTLDIPVRITAHNPNWTQLGTLVWATAAGTSSRTAAIASPGAGTPTAVSTGMWADRMNLLPEQDRDALPPDMGGDAAPSGPVAGGWMTGPYAGYVQRGPNAQPPAAELVSGLSAEQVSALQTNPSAAAGNGLDASQCTLTATGRCTITADVAVTGEAAAAGTVLLLGMNTEPMGARELSSALSAPTVTVDGAAADVGPANDGAWWSYQVSSEAFKNEGRHRVVISLTGPQVPYPAEYALFVDQKVGQDRRWPGTVGVSVGNGTFSPFIAMPGALSLKQAAELPTAAATPAPR